MKRSILLFLSASLLVMMYSCNGGSTTNGKETQADEAKEAQTESAEKKTVPAASPDETRTEPKTEPDKAKEPEQPAPSAAEEGPEPFDYLTKLYFGQNKRLMVKYNPKYTEVINKKLNELDEADPLKALQSYENFGTVLMKTKVKPNGDDYVVFFSSGPSADPTYYFFKDGDFSGSAFYIMTHKLFIPANGNLYSIGYTGWTIEASKKYVVRNNDIKEVAQPFYYAGKKSKTERAIKLYATQQLRSVVASLPADYPVEIVLEDAENGQILVKTNFGLVGWVRTEMGVIEEFRWSSD